MSTCHLGPSLTTINMGSLNIDQHMMLYYVSCHSLAGTIDIPYQQYLLMSAKPMIVYGLRDYYTNSTHNSTCVLMTSSSIVLFLLVVHFVSLVMVTCLTYSSHLMVFLRVVSLPLNCLLFISMIWLMLL